MCLFLLCSYVDFIMFVKEIVFLLYFVVLFYYYNEVWLCDGECEFGSVNNER